MSHDAAAFVHVDTWIFDLDNTLYPAGSDLWPKIDQRITLWMMAFYGLDGISARALQKFYYLRHGTTLRGLMETDAIEAETFLDFVHDVDRTSLTADAMLVAAITALPGRKLILTNGTRSHAEETLKCLGLDGIFEDIFDIVSGSLIPKPEAATYNTFLQYHEIDPRHSVIFEDIPRNLIVPSQLGMTTVLVTSSLDLSTSRENFEILGEEIPSYIDFVTSDLAAFCGRLGVVRSS